MEAVCAKTTAAASRRCWRVIARRRSGSAARSPTGSTGVVLAIPEILAGMILASMSDTSGMQVRDRNGRRTRVPAAGEPPTLHVEDLHKAYGATALAGVDLEVGRGTILGLLGPQRRRQDVRWCRSSPGCAAPTRARCASAAWTPPGHPSACASSIGFAPQDTGVYSDAHRARQPAVLRGLAGTARREARRDPIERSAPRSARRAVRPARRRSCRVVSAAGCTPRSRSCTGRGSCCSTSRRPAPTSGRGRQIVALVREPRGRRLGGRVLDALPARDRGARRVRRVHRPGADRRARGRRGARARHGSSVRRADLRGRVPRSCATTGATVDGSSVRIPTAIRGRRPRRLPAARGARRRAALGRGRAPQTWSRSSSRSRVAATTATQPGTRRRELAPTRRRHRRERAPSRAS